MRKGGKAWEAKREEEQSASYKSHYPAPNESASILGC
jgi:hypothetical protein